MTDSYANIISGVVKLSKGMSDGRQQIVGLQFAPDFIGRPFARESALTAEAAIDIDICVVPAPALERLVMPMRRVSDTGCTNQALKELDEARDWMLTLGRKTAQEKVASFLLSHRHPHRSGERQRNMQFELPLIARRYRRFPRPHHRDRQPADDQAAQGQCDPHRKQPSRHRAKHGPVDAGGRHRLSPPSKVQRVSALKKSRKTAAHFSGKCSISLFYAFSDGKPLRTFPGNAFNA